MLALSRQSADFGAGCHKHLRGGGFDEAPLTALRRRRIELTRHLHRAQRHVTEQNNAAFTLLQGVCTHHPFVVDHTREQSIGPLGREQHIAAIGSNKTFVLDQGVDRTLFHIDFEQP